MCTNKKSELINNVTTLFIGNVGVAIGALANRKLLTNISRRIFCVEFYFHMSFFVTFLALFDLFVVTV